MTSKDLIKDIQMFINEAYSDNEPLQDNQARSKKVFNDYCNKIKQDLERLEKLEKVFSDLKSMFEINIGIDCGNEYFIEIKQSDSGISELIPQEDIKIFKEVLCDE